MLVTRRPALQGAICHKRRVSGSCTIRPGAGCSMAGQSCHCGFQTPDVNKAMWFPASIFKAQKYAAKFLPTSSQRSANRCWALRDALPGSVCARGMWLEHQQVTEGAGASTCCRFWTQFPHLIYWTCNIWIPQPRFSQGIWQETLYKRGLPLCTV